MPVPPTQVRPTQVRNTVVALAGRYKGMVVTVRYMILADSCLDTDDDSMYDPDARPDLAVR